jgi:endonuclease YncB( thermonuclease family)
MQTMKRNSRSRSTRPARPFFEQLLRQAAPFALVTLAFGATLTACGRAASDPAELASRRSGPPSAKPTEGPRLAGTIVSCHDGDTCHLRLDGQKVMILRLAGIDAPEVMGGPDNKGQPFGQAARDFLVGQVKGKAVSVRAIELDPYGRTVAEIYDATGLVNLRLVQQGLAEAYRYATSRVDKAAYRAAEDTAKAAKLGVWSEGSSYVSPGDFRRSNKP